ncbi:MAG: hypothetical protein PHW57_02440 [Candidatus Shapirobacteria bacterium]|nr:hypothetical protein [Candidatus Shapirobacteria bacterium]MDD5074190.1 hypothetical protein [Candidatus Shapirobacteria bacterium]
MKEKAAPSEPSAQEAQEQSRETVSDPRRLISLWKGSPQYQQAYEKFFAGKRPAPDVTEAEKQYAFEGGYQASQSLIVFVQEGDYQFSYSSEEYPKPVREAVNNYVESAKFLIDQYNHGDRDDLLRADKNRAYFHNELARQLVNEEIVSTTKIGRAFGRIILIDLGLDTFSSARRTDEDRAKVLAYQNLEL